MKSLFSSPGRQSTLVADDVLISENLTGSTSDEFDIIVIQAGTGSCRSCDCKGFVKDDYFTCKCGHHRDQHR